MREEQEFLDGAANQLINLFAMDSAVARALEAAGSPDAHTHELLSMSVLTLIEPTRSAIEAVLTMTFDGEERREELARVRRYLGDPEENIVPLQRELAELVASKGQYPLD